MENMNDRMDRIEEAGKEAAMLGHKAIFDFALENEGFNDTDKTVITIVAVVNLMASMFEAATTNPEHDLPRRLLKKMVEKVLAPRIGDLYSAEGVGVSAEGCGHA